MTHCQLFRKKFKKSVDNQTTKWYDLVVDGKSTTDTEVIKVVNEKLIKSKIVEQGLTQEKVAEQLGISVSALNYKLKGKNEFKANEIFSLSRLLKIKNKDKYFFAQNVDTE